MHRSLLAIFAAVVLLAAPFAANAGLTNREASVLREMNRVRAQNGLPALRLDTHLQRAAVAHSREMLATDVFSHGAFARRMLHFDVKGRIAGENLAWGTGDESTARAIVAAWLASPEHRANLLRPSFRRTGVGDLIGRFQGYGDARVVTADFAG
jgi:uncharacterized protein YkwD